MEMFHSFLELVAVISAFSTFIYHLATIRTKIKSNIDNTFDIATQRINNLDNKINIHIAEYNQQMHFNRELREHFKDEIHEKFALVFSLIKEFQENYEDINLDKDNGEDSLRHRS